MFPKSLSEFFHFSRKDRIGIIALVILILVMYFLPVLFSRSLDADSDLIARAIDTLEHRNEESKSPLQNSRKDQRSAYFPRQKMTPAILFRFDPNKISAEDWQKLGLSEKTSRTIINYRSKGGRFNKPEDLQKIWSLPADFYKRVRDYVAIAIEPSQSAPTFRSLTHLPAFSPSTPLTVDVNTADTSTLITLPGIGSRLALRIVTFREKLGGFYSIDQVGETYGLADSTFQKLRKRLTISSKEVRKNINTLDKETLKTHPYIRWALANAIVEYRGQHGPFKTLEDLKQISLMDEATYTRLLPYLEY